MKNPALKLAVLLLSIIAFAFVARADSLTNNFDTSRDYINNGIVGDTFWDGIYLTGSDLPNGTGTGGTTANTLIANANGTFAGYFTVRTTGGDWADANDDGFFLYKVVSGDFDLSVQSAPPWAPVANQFGGVLARAWNTNNAGSPFSTLITNFSENYVEMMRGQEFGISEVRLITNGVGFERTFADPAADDGSGTGTNAMRYYRIVRSEETNFMFFWRTNNTQDWTQRTNNTNFPNGVYVRPDLAGVPMQVGINHAMFANAQATAFFTDFQISGPNVTATPTTLPPAPTDIITTDTNIGGSLTISWTKGDPGDNSLVIVKASGLIRVNPVQGLAYASNPVFGTADSRTNAQMGSGQFVVYNGSGNSVTVTNLKANNITYTVAVYEYTNTGATLIYNTAAPATNAFVGPGVINAVALSTVTSTNIPVGGAATFRLLATFSTGEANVDVSATTAWSSADTTIADVSALGIIQGVLPGTAQIIATFGTFVLSNAVTVHSPIFTDNFSAVQDYVANGLAGSVYDGLFLNFGDVPGTVVAGGDGPGSTAAFDSHITSTNGLYLSSVQSTWEGTANDGPFLYRIVPGRSNGVSGDFQASIHINTMNTLNGSVAGIMARLYNPANHGRGPNNAEYHVNYWKVQNGTSSVRRTQNGGLTTVLGAGPAAADGWLLIQRADSTNFFFYERATTNAQWLLAATTILAAASNNAPMEVGIAGQSTLGVNEVAIFDSLMLDAPGISAGVTPPPPATNVSLTLNGDLSVTLNWVAADSLGNPIQSIVVMRSNAPVTAQPFYGEALSGNSIFGQGTDLGGRNYVVYVSPASPPSTNNSVTVTGLSIGTTYYAAVYTVANSGGTNVFNNVVTSGGIGNQLVGFLTGYDTLTTTFGIPMGGLSFLQVIAHYQGGVNIDSTAAATFSTLDTNVLRIIKNFASGMTNGNATVTTVFGGFTSNTTVTVRPPTFTDEFNVNHDYLVDGVTGSGWDGLFNPNGATNPIPGSRYVPLALSSTSVADANVTSNSMLSIASSGDGWENNNSGGFFLYKYVPGDFQVAVHISSFDVAGFNQPGLLARAFASSNDVLGLPLGYSVPNANGTNDFAEYWVSLCRFDEFNIGTYARRNIDGGVSQNTQIDQGDTNFWLLIIRTGGTKFDFFKRLNPTDPWRRVPNNTSYDLAQFANQPMQAGIMAGPWNGNVSAQLGVRFEHFMLDSTTGLKLSITTSGGDAVVTWPPGPNQILQSSPSVQPGVSWTDVPGTPTLGTNGYSLSVPIGSDPQFFRLRN